MNRESIIAKLERGMMCSHPNMDYKIYKKDFDSRVYNIVGSEEKISDFEFWRAKTGSHWNIAWKAEEPVDKYYVSGNEFSKSYKWNDLEVFVLKASNEDAPQYKHLVIVTIPEISILDVKEIKYPFSFETEVERDFFYNTFDCNEFCLFVVKEIDSRKSDKAGATSKG